jgi:3-hydroxy-9,10-secoandrosta-1,3,5(10)-triene-9,17-dione monooxygenase reductase component
VTSATPVDPHHFRSALGAFATGITIVTTVGLDGEDVGMTASSFNSVSLDPPMVLWSIGKNAMSRPAFAAAEFFAVHVLANDQQTLSDRFAKRGTDKFGGLEVERGPGGVPLLMGCTARFECRTAYRYEGGDHDILVGEVVKFDHLEKLPLIFHRGRYGELASPAGAGPELAAEDATFSGSFLGFLLPRALWVLLDSIRRELNRLEISMDQYFALCALAVRSRTVSDIDRVARFYDRRFDQASAAELTARGYVEPRDSSNAETALALTEAGRRLVLELLAIGKDAEATLLDDFDPADVHRLKSFLRRIGRRGSASPASTSHPA